MKKSLGILICLIGLIFIMNMPALAEEAVTGPAGAAISAAAPPEIPPAKAVTQEALDAVKSSLQVGIDTTWCSSRPSWSSS